MAQETKQREAVVWKSDDEEDEFTGTLPEESKQELYVGTWRSVKRVIQAIHVNQFSRTRQFYIFEMERITFDTRYNKEFHDGYEMIRLFPEQLRRFTNYLPLGSEYRKEIITYLNLVSQDMKGEDWEYQCSKGSSVKTCKCAKCVQNWWKQNHMEKDTENDVENLCNIGDEEEEDETMNDDE